MWCIGQLTTQYRERMYELCDLYARPYDPQEPVVGVDEKSKQLLDTPRGALTAKPGQSAKEDYEYERRGTCNLFMAVEPKGRHREVVVTEQRTKVDFVCFICHLLHTVYATVKVLHLVLDNLNTHFASAFQEVLGVQEATGVLNRIHLHYTPKHASWLNVAEIEIGIMEKQCTGGRRMAEHESLASEVAVWEHRRNVEKRGINWQFTREDADRKLGRHYVT
jgi:hypothetical protein